MADCAAWSSNSGVHKLLLTGRAVKLKVAGWESHGARGRLLRGITSGVILDSSFAMLHCWMLLQMLLEKVLGLGRSGCLTRSCFNLELKKDCLPDSRDLAAILVFLTCILACRGGKLVSAWRLQMRVHMGAPSMSLIALFCKTSSKVDWASVSWERTGVL